MTGLDCGLGVSKTCWRDAVAGTDGRGPRTGVIFVIVPRMSAGWGAEGGMMVIAATAANELSLPRERELESSKMFIRENWAINPSISNEGRATTVFDGDRSHLGAPKFVTPFLDGKGSYELGGGYDDGNACGGAIDSRGLYEVSLICEACASWSVVELEGLRRNMSTLCSSVLRNFSIRR